MTPRWRSGVARIVIAFVLLLGAGNAAAEEDAEPATSEAASSPWEFDAMLYGWIPGTYGSLNVDGHRVAIDSTPYDVLKLVESGDALAAAGYFSLTYDRFTVFTDTFGGYGKVDVTEEIPTQLCTLQVRARDTLKFVIGDVGFAYRLGQWSLPHRQHPLTLGVYAGARYMYFSNDLEATAGVVGAAQKSANVFESFAWADPLIGVRWSVPVLDWASLEFRGDIGGFGASSDLIWGISSNFRLWLPWSPYSTKPFVAVGYRVTAFDRSNTDANIDLQMRGAVVGLGFLY